MTKDRLSDIWAGFTDRSTLDLSGTGVDDIPRPSRRDESFERAYRLPEMKKKGETAAQDPVAAALSAMHAEIQMAAGQGRNGRYTPAEPHHSEPPKSALEQTLLADLAFTRSKTTRRGSDYLSFASSRQADWQKRKRKKFLGIF